MRNNILKLVNTLALLTLVNVAWGAAPAQVPATGETNGAAGSGSGIAWPTPRFIAGTGVTANCITDKLTGLMWAQNSTIGFESVASGVPIAQPDYQNTNSTLNGMSWGNSSVAVSNMNAASNKLCGYSDWRVPNKIEMASLINYGAADPANWLMYGDGNQAHPACDGACFSNVQSGGSYWTSSYNASQGRFSLAWSIIFYNGNPSVYPLFTFPSVIGALDNVWPVRGG
jgi:hypothetical protein